MGEISTIGLDLAKSVFQVHAVDEAGRVVLRSQIKRAQLLAFFAALTPCLVGMEACSGAHYWARELGKLGHEARLMPPSYVKPYVKRGKTDAADAEAICEAVTRPNMRFVPIKTQEQQSVLLMHRVRDFLVRQLTQVSNALRAHLGEFGLVVPKGLQNIERLVALAEAGGLPVNALNAARLLAEQFRDTRIKVEDVTTEINRASQTDPAARRLKSIPGIGPITSSVLAATLPDATGFKTARDLAAWLGLTPKPHSSGGKERLGKISKMGNRYIRRLLYLGAMGVIAARRRKPAGDDWLGQMLARKPVKLVAIALASRMARTVWALLRSGESYQAMRA